MNKNLIFYSMHPNDTVSQQCIAAISNNEEFNRQFIRICVHHPQNYNMPPPYRLPNIINQLRSRNLIPVLAVSGFKKPVLAQDALNWLQDNALKALNGGISACNLNPSATDNCSTIMQAELAGSELFGTEYNMGFADAKGETGKMYSNIDEAAEGRIMTYDDISTKKRASQETQSRLDMIKAQRQSEVPQPLMRTSVSGASRNNMSGGSGGMPMMPMMPNMMQQRGNGGMPMMPMMQGGGGNAMMPMMPMMPMMQQRR